MNFAAIASKQNRIENPPTNPTLSPVIPFEAAQIQGALRSISFERRKNA